GLAHHGRLEHARMRGEDALYLHHGHVLPGDLQHVAAPAGEPETAVIVSGGQVAGVEPAAVEGTLGCVRVVKVTGEDLVAALAADDDLADPAGLGHRARGRVAELDGAARSHGSHDIGGGLERMAGDDGGPGLRHPVQLPRPAAEQPADVVVLTGREVLREPAVPEPVAAL